MYLCKTSNNMKPIFNGMHSQFGLKCGDPNQIVNKTSGYLYQIGMFGSTSDVLGGVKTDIVFFVTISCSLVCTHASLHRFGILEAHG